MLLKHFLLLLSIVISSSMAVDIGMNISESDSHSHHTSLETIESSRSGNSTELVRVPYEMKHQHGLPILETELTPAERLYWEQYNTTTYFTVESPHKVALWYHCFTILICFIFLYPTSLMLNTVESKCYIPILTIHNIILISSLISLKIYGSSVPDLYPNNAYSKMSWILLFSSIVHYFIAVLYYASKWFTGEWIALNDDNRTNQEFIPLENYDFERDASPSHSTLLEFKRSSGETTSHQHSLSSAPEILYHKGSIDLETELHSQETHTGSHFKHDHFSNNNTPITQKNNSLDKIFQNSTIKFISEKFKSSISIIFVAMNLPMLAYLFIYVSTGTAVGSLMAQQNHVFNILAHYIKGGVFVTLGVFSLARYCGCLQKKGLAWNKVIVLKNQVNTKSFWYKIIPYGMITMEGYESFLILFYGATNVFLEHLSSKGGSWDAKDLQHVSIAFMYIGSGLCGLVTENILSEWRFDQVLTNTKINPNAIHAGSPGFSPNPFPVFTIFWTGILMSQHKQSSQTATDIHMQWGYLLAYGSFFRLLTFILLMLQPNKNLNPARPFTELITSFCLIAGGFIFMQSNDQTVQALKYRGFTSMFTLNVNVSCVALLMCWEMLLLVWKSRLQSKKQL